MFPSSPLLNYSFAMFLFAACSVSADLTAPSDEGAPSMLVGASPALPEAHPSFAFAAQESYGQHYAGCGATVIHEDVLMTAAHCYEHFQPGQQICIGGIYADCSDATDIATVASQYIHSEYSPVTTQNDIMLVKLASPVTAPAATWNVDETLPEPWRYATAVGLGGTRDDVGISAFPSDLQELQVMIYEDSYCSQVLPEYDSYGWLYHHYDSESMMCMSTGVCFGDSGGPLFSASGEILGIASFLVGGCQSGQPSFYTRVSHYDEWIQSSICGLSTNPPAGCVGARGFDPNFTFVAPCGPQTKTCENGGIIMNKLSSWLTGSWSFLAIPYFMIMSLIFGDRVMYTHKCVSVEDAKQMFLYEGWRCGDSQFYEGPSN